jgi:CheY-like chemotaxis protein
MENEILNILLADDDADDRLFFKEAMDEINIGTMVSVVNDGSKLIEYLNQSNEYLPDIIFLDINMPVKNGLECLRELREDLRFKDIHIVIYSTSGADKDIEEAYNCGANMYLKKPGDFAQLKASLANVLTDTFHAIN